MLTCSKCGGRVFIDRTFSDNVTYEPFCLLCGKRYFVHSRHPMYALVDRSEKEHRKTV